MHRFHVWHASVLLAGALLATLPASAQTPLPYRIGYWYTGDNVPPASMNGQWNGLNYLIIGDLYANADGSITFSDPNHVTSIPAICNAARANGVQCIIDLAAIGPGDLGGAVDNNLSTLVANLISIINTYGFVGLSTDWEIGWSQTRNDSFTHALRPAIGSKLILEGADWSAFTYFGGAIQSFIDGIIVGGYDQGYCDAGGISWFNSALFNDASGGGAAGNAFSWEFLRARFVNAGTPAAKIVMGTTFNAVLYGNVNQPRQACSPPGPTSVPGTRIDYRLVPGTYNISNPNRDAVTHEAWITVDSTHWLDVQDGPALADKVNYLQQHSMGGFALFNLHEDYMPTATPQHPLVAAVEAALVGSPPTISSFTAAPATIAPGASSSLAWVEAGGATCSINQGVGVVPCSPSSRAVTPAATTTYTLTVTNPAGSVTRNATVTVTPAQTACVNGPGDAAFVQGALNRGGHVTLTGTCSLGTTTLTFGSGLTIDGTATLNYTGSGYIFASSGNNNTITGLTLNGGGIHLTLNDGTNFTGQFGWTITNNTIQNITSTAGGVNIAAILGKGAHSTISNNTFRNIWIGGYPNNISNPGSIRDTAGGGIFWNGGLDNTLIDSNHFVQIMGNAIKGFMDYFRGNSFAYIAHNVVVTNNDIEQEQRIGVEVQGIGRNACPGGCNFGSESADGTIFAGNYMHNFVIGNNQFGWSVLFGGTNNQYINNTVVNSNPACTFRLAIANENGMDGGISQGNIIAGVVENSPCNTGGNPVSWAAGEVSSFTHAGFTNRFNNNIYCMVNIAASHGTNSDNATNIFTSEYSSASCPSGYLSSTSNIALAFSSANNQSFPSGGNGTWNNSVISNLSIRQVQYFIDGSSTAAVTQQVQDVSNTFTADRKWLYHATISTTGMAAGSHTITAVATDVSGATQSVSQGFTVGSLIRSRGPEPGLPFARIPAGHAECEFGMILDTLLAPWNQNCLTTEIKNVNTYLTAGKSTSQSFTLFPQSILQQYNVKLTKNGVSGQSGIVGFGGDDIGANLGDPGFRSYVFDTYIPTILMPHAPNQTPVYVSIDNYLNPGRSWFGVTTNGSWSNAGVTWDPPFAQTDPAWNLLVAGWYQYATIHAPNIRLDPHLGSIAVSDWAAFPTLFQYTPSLMREWFNISGLHGYSASVRQQNYLGLYWFEQFGNHFAPVFPADGTTRTFHWGVQPDNGDYHSAFANYLMVRGPNSFFDIIETVNGLATGVDPNRWLPIAKALGTATSDIINAVVAPGHVAGDGYSLMERTWTNGIAYNNMTGVTQTVTLPAGSLAWVCTATPPCTFSPVSQLVLPDGIGDVILLSAPTGVPVITSFTSNPAQVNIGSSSTLSWSTTGATSLTLNPGNINVTGLTSSVVTPSSTTTYTLTATNSVGSIQRTVAVTVRLPASYFVSSSTGVDTNPGTQAAPWRTISKASAGPAGGYIPADSVLLKAGDTWCQTGGTCAFPATFTANFTTPSSGTSGNPITYGTYGTGAAPILDGSGGFGVVLSRNFITWNGIQIKNIAGTGILFSNTTGTQIRNVTATNVNNWAFKGYQVGTSTLDGNTCTSTSGFVQLSGCIIAQVNGATPQTQTITATHNTCHFDFLNTASSGGNVICVEVGGPVATNSSIVGNLSFGGTQFGGFKPGSCTGAGTADVCFGQVTGGLIADNEIHKAIFFGTPGSTTLVGDGETIELQGAPTAIQTGVIVTRNVIYGQQSVGGVTGGTNVAGNTNDLIGLFQAQGNSIYGNVLVCPCGNEYAIQFETNAGGNSVFNNTIIQAPLNLAISNIPTQMAIRIGTDSNETIKNNIISGFAQGITGNNSNISDYNLFTSTVTSPVLGGIVAGTNSIIGSTPASVFVTTPAVLQNDVKLIAGSLAASAGLNLGVAFSGILDPSGTVVPYSVFTQTTSWEMGAFGTTLLTPARTVINGAVISGAVIQ